MVKKYKGKKRNNKRLLLLVFAGVLLSLSALLTAGEKWNLSFLPTWEDVFAAAGLQERPVENYSGLTVAFLDVGQGDCAVITAGDFHAMIDGGEAENAAGIINYLKARNITQLDYVFATHPHADHIGALAQVIRAVPPKNVMMPKLSEKLAPATQADTDFLNAVEESGAKAVYAKVGEQIAAGEGMLEVLGPAYETTELNDTSLILRLQYGNRSFLFTGDGEKTAEKNLLSSGVELEADVLKAGHHGSKTSNGDEFLTAVAPKHAVISCGVNNTYGHPDAELLKRMGQHQVTCYRTDQSGTVTCTTDGNDLFFAFEKEAA